MLFINPKLNIKTPEDPYFKATPVEITRKKKKIRLEGKLITLILVLIGLSVFSFLMVLL